MMTFILGASLMLNAALGLAVYKLYTLLHPKQENPYAGLEDLMRDDNWSRIDSLEPPRTGAELPHTLVATAGRREKAPTR